MIQEISKMSSNELLELRREISAVLKQRQEADERRKLQWNYLIKKEYREVRIEDIKNSLTKKERRDCRSFLVLSLNALSRANVETLFDLDKLSRFGAISIKKMGPTRYTRLMEWLVEKGYAYKSHVYR